MRRFFGMMPSSEIEIEKTFADEPGSRYRERIQAGPNGWSIIWADGGSTFKDEVHTAEENFEIALAILKDSFPKAVEMVLVDEPRGEVPAEFLGERCEVREEYVEKPRKEVNGSKIVLSEMTEF